MVLNVAFHDMNVFWDLSAQFVFGNIFILISGIALMRSSILTNVILTNVDEREFMTRASNPNCVLACADNSSYYRDA
jgi:hypothetical protein